MTVSDSEFQKRKFIASVDFLSLFFLILFWIFFILMCSFHWTFITPMILVYLFCFAITFRKNNILVNAIFNYKADYITLISSHNTQPLIEITGEAFHEERSTNWFGKENKPERIVTFRAKREFSMEKCRDFSKDFSDFEQKSFKVAIFPFNPKNIFIFF